MVVLEPLSIDRTRMLSWGMTDRDEHDAGVQAMLDRGGTLVDLGATEDRDVACAIQRSLASGANQFFEFGLFEGAIGHFHRALHALLGA